MIGKQVAQYLIEGDLGAGGRGDVYQARDTRLVAGEAGDDRISVVLNWFREPQERVPVK